MDEAERCHRLAILDHGKLVADGSPGELMDALPGTALLVACENPREAQKALADVPSVIATAQIGAHLRVLARNGDDAAEAISRKLHDSGIDADVKPAAPNLEDVFVAATSQSRTNGTNAADAKRRSAP